MLALAAGCGDATAPITSADVVGVYALSSIDGQTMPAPFGVGSTIVFDSLSLGADGTWRDHYASGTLSDSTPREERTFSGTWTLDAKSRIIQVSYPAPPRSGSNPTLTSLYRVDPRAAVLTLDAGPVNPARPGGGIWVYQRVP